MIEILRDATVRALRAGDGAPMLCDRYRQPKAILLVLFMLEEQRPVEGHELLRARRTVSAMEDELRRGLDELVTLGLAVAREGVGYRWHGAFFEELVAEAQAIPSLGAPVAAPAPSPSIEPAGDDRAPRPDSSGGGGRDGGAHLEVLDETGGRG